jgi:uncharacterized membrane protein AbrB (regulator of aidB expression)
MAAMALFLGYDPVYVSMHHLARILVLIAVLPWMMSRTDRHPPPP